MRGGEGRVGEVRGGEGRVERGGEGRKGKGNINYTRYNITAVAWDKSLRCVCTDIPFQFVK